MITREEIDSRRKFLVEEFHQARVKEQQVDQTYYDDAFDVSVISSQAPHKYLSRTGTAASIIDGPVSHIITKNPQVFLSPRKGTEGARESSRKVNSLLNHWARYLLKQTPQPYREFTKKLMLRGEAWLQPLLNERWLDNKEYFPIYFLVPDPLNIFGSATEEYGVPDYVVVYYERIPFMVQQKYPKWTNPKQAGETNKPHTVKWFEYWDRDVRYFEADGEPVLRGKDGIQENIYGKPPFIHALSGFGETSPDGKPETLVVGRLRKVRGLLVQECAINSDIDSTLHKFAQPKIDLIIPAGAEFNEESIKENYDMSAGSLNILAIPEGSKFGEDTRILPSKEAFQHYYNIRTRIAQEAPPIMAGLPSGSSGRQEDILGYHFIRRFDSIVEATEGAFSKGLNFGLDILKRIPGSLPITQWLDQPDGGKKEIIIDKEDIDATADTRLELKAADPIEDDRKLMAGRVLVNEKLIDWRTFLTQYAGYTPEKTEDIIEQTIADRVVMENPMIFQALAEKAMENLGMQEYLEKLRQQIATQDKMNTGLQQAPQLGQPGPLGGPPRQMNVQSTEGMNAADMLLTQGGVRQSPGV